MLFFRSSCTTELNDITKNNRERQDKGATSSDSGLAAIMVMNCNDHLRSLQSQSICPMATVNHI